MHPNGALIFEKYARPYFKSGMRVLEIGADSKGPFVYRDMVGHPAGLWETVDIHRSFPGLTYVARDEYSFPVAGETFDIVFSAQVIEHVRKIWVWIKELARVCKPGGHVITINPVSWPYHAAPVDCWRIYPEGMKALYVEAGLKVLLSCYESLEKMPTPHSHPGPTYDPGRGAVQNLKFLLKKLIGWPMTYAVDTVTIGTKER